MIAGEGWQSARDEFERYVMPKLNSIGKEIGAAANGGNELAKEIIALYAMLYRSFDPMTSLLLKEKIEEYELGTKRTP